MTHHSTLSAEIRKIANSCDLGDFNKDFFIVNTFISDIASYVQKKEDEAFQRGLNAHKNSPECK